MIDLIDKEQRVINYLRLSVTNRCNLKCIYCVGADKFEAKYLTIDEIERVANIFATLGITKVKLTGGEPLIRSDLANIVKRLRSAGMVEVTLTTNGLLLEQKLTTLIAAGVTAINVSLDAIDGATFEALTGVAAVNKVMQAVEASAKVVPTKINSLLIKGTNDSEIVPLIEFAAKAGVAIRFIELMPIGCGTIFEGVGADQVKDVIASKYGELVAYEKQIGNGPAKYFWIESLGIALGFINALSDCFCDKCNRIRLTADGFLKPCLHFGQGLDVYKLFALSDIEILEEIRNTIYNKPIKHHLLEGISNESKMMVQIGG
ncbi:GTP 3',8-cyclase MoaA [Candidatus Epulonipiscium viviparus]|uniref:GTP 3',8-cyclase MoaA n=1 Tax=Candidatus Epulonipiscium viviparus TaxID=420336 RepID=UPI000A04FA42|nr:GTP 3',8-cyclase MoaA [Candidatus Epulopiscium viviparus]